MCIMPINKSLIVITPSTFGWVYPYQKSHRMNQCPRLLTEHVLLPDKLKCRVFLVRTNLAPPLRTYKHSVQAKEEAAGFLAWVFVTEGMLANKQAEMVFVLKLDEKEASNLDNTDKLVESVPTRTFLKSCSSCVVLTHWKSL